MRWSEDYVNYVTLVKAMWTGEPISVVQYLNQAVPQWRDDIDPTSHNAQVG